VFFFSRVLPSPPFPFQRHIDLNLALLFLPLVYRWIFLDHPATTPFPSRISVDRVPLFFSAPSSSHRQDPASPPISRTARGPSLCGTNQGAQSPFARSFSSFRETKILPVRISGTSRLRALLSRRRPGPSFQRSLLTRSPLCHVSFLREEFFRSSYRDIVPFLFFDFFPFE